MNVIAFFVSIKKNIPARMSCLCRS